MPPPVSLSQLQTRPDWVQRINAMGDSVGGAARLVPFAADALVRTAIESSGGLSDFGAYP